jgi:hypothetical protein
MQKRGLTDLAEAKINALRNEGYSLTDSDVIALNDIARDIQTDVTRMALSKGKPLRCGNLWLWPFTIHMKAWLNDCGYEMQSFPDASWWAMAYALSHREDELYEVTEKQVHEWSKHFKGTTEELKEGLLIMLANDKKDETPDIPGDSVTIHEMARIMFLRCGGSIDMWEKECAIDFIYDMQDTLSKQDEANGTSAKKDRSQMAFTYLTHRIRRRVKE